MIICLTWKSVLTCSTLCKEECVQLLKHTLANVNVNLIHEGIEWWLQGTEELVFVYEQNFPITQLSTPGTGFRLELSIKVMQTPVCICLT